MRKLTIIFALLFCFVITIRDAGVKAASPKTTKDIPFAIHADTKNRFTSLDVYSPAKGKDHPVMVYVHGGAWKIGDKRRVDLKPAYFVEQGYVFVSVNYRLHPAVTWKQQAGDVATAISWVKKNIKTYGGTSEKISIMGHSAGAHLAALVATDESYLKTAGMKLSQLQSVILLDGAGYDVPLQMKRNQLGWFTTVLENVFSKDEKQQQAASPVHHVSAKKGIPPFLILHVAGRANSKAQSESFGKKLTDAGVSAKVIACEDKTHSTINRELGKENDQPTTDITKFIKALNDK